MTALRRLLPDPGPADLGAALDAIVERTPVLGVMIASVDGRATVGGRSAPLRVPADRDVFHGVRERIDAVLVGAETVRAEGYRRLVPDQARRAARLARGLEAEPLALVLTRRDRPPEPIGSDPEARVVVHPGAGPAEALRRARERGVRRVACEGGPVTLAAALAEGVLDGLLLTLSPTVAGGEELALVGPAAPRAALRLESVHEADGGLFLHYVVG